MLNLCKISYCCVSRIDTLKYIVRGFLDVRGVWVSDLYPRYQFVMSPYTLPHIATLHRVTCPPHLERLAQSLVSVLIVIVCCYELSMSASIVCVGAGAGQVWYAGPVTLVMWPLHTHHSYFTAPPPRPRAQFVTRTIPLNTHFRETH